MQIKSISEYIKKKLHIFTPFLVFILIIISFFVVSVVKHQKVQIQKQVVKVEITGKNWINNSIQTEGYRPPFWLLKNLEIGAKELNPDGRVVAEIVDIDYFEVENSNAEIILTIKLETVDNFSSGRTIYKGKNVEVGSELEFHFNNTLLLGQVTGIFDETYLNQDSRILVKGVYRAVPAYIADSINIGMRIDNPYTGKNYALINEKKVNFSSDSILYRNNHNSKLYLRSDYTLKDVELEIELTVNEAFDNYYYSMNQTVKVGQPLSLFFPKLNIIDLEVKDVVSIDTNK